MDSFAKCPACKCFYLCFKSKWVSVLSVLKEEQSVMVTSLFMFFNRLFKVVSPPPNKMSSRASNTHEDSLWKTLVVQLSAGPSLNSCFLQQGKQDKWLFGLWCCHHTDQNDKQINTLITVFAEWWMIWTVLCGVCSAHTPHARTHKYIHTSIHTYNTIQFSL